MCPNNGKPEVRRFPSPPRSSRSLRRQYIIETNVRYADEGRVITICRFSTGLLAHKRMRHLGDTCRRGSSSTHQAAKFDFKVNPTFRPKRGTIHIIIECSEPLTASEVHSIRWFADKCCLKRWVAVAGAR